MRHRKVTKKLGRNTSHRRALLRNLVTSLIMEERLETTPAKAKAMRPHVEKMITLGKRGDLAARRLAGSYLMTRNLSRACLTPSLRALGTAMAAICESSTRDGAQETARPPYTLNC